MALWWWQDNNIDILPISLYLTTCTFLEIDFQNKFQEVLTDLTVVVCELYTWNHM